MRFIFSNVSSTPQTRLSRFTPFSLQATQWSLRDGRQDKTSLALFVHMLASQVQPINLTFPSLINAVCSSFSVSSGVALHGQALKRGVLWDPFVQVSFVGFYGEVSGRREMDSAFSLVNQICSIISALVLKHLEEPSLGLL